MAVLWREHAIAGDDDDDTDQHDDDDVAVAATDGDSCKALECYYRCMFYI